MRVARNLVLDLLRSIEQHIPDSRSRIVFWFDN
jgi:hypothetical protein